MCGTVARLGCLEIGTDWMRGRGYPDGQEWALRFRQRHPGGMFDSLSKTPDPPSDPVAKNCECRYHIIVTNVNRKTDAAHQNYRWLGVSGTGRRLAGFGLGESEYWKLRLRINAWSASAPLYRARTCKACARWSQSAG